MEKCYMIRIWRRVGIDLVKIWMVYREEKGELELSDNVDKLLNFVVNELIPELNDLLQETIVNKFGEAFAEELKYLEDEIILYGDYDNYLEPVIAYEYIWWEVLAGVFPDLPDEIMKVISQDDKFATKREFGEFLTKGLVKIEHKKYPIKMIFGIHITEKTNCEYYFL